MLAERLRKMQFVAVSRLVCHLIDRLLRAAKKRGGKTKPFADDLAFGGKPSLLFIKAAEIGGAKGEASRIRPER